MYVHRLPFLSRAPVVSRNENASTKKFYENS